MARSKTFRKKRKYKHSNKHSNNKRTSKRTSKKNYKKTYKKRRPMKGGWGVNGLKDLAGKALGKELFDATDALARDAYKTQANSFKTDLAAQTSPAFANALQRRAEGLASNKAMQKQVLDTGLTVANVIKKQAIIAYKKLEQELEEAEERAKRAQAVEKTAIQDENKYKDDIKLIEIELGGLAVEVAAEKEDAEKAEAIRKQEAEKAAAEKAAAEKAEATRKQEEEKRANIYIDVTTTLEDTLAKAKAKLEKAKKQREEANKVNSEAIKEAAELRQRVKVAQQEIQVAERVPPGTPLDPDMQQAIPLPIGPPTRTPLPPITR